MATGSASKASTGSFRSTVWSPLLITSQIICMQCSFYFGLSLWIFLVDFLIIGTGRSISQVFEYEKIGFHHLSHILILTSFVLNSLTTAFSLRIIVKRTKQCWDFSTTIFIIHLIVCWIYNGYFPKTITWWLLSIINVIITTVLGEFLCMRAEMKSIPIGKSSIVEL